MNKIEFKKKGKPVNELTTNDLYKEHYRTWKKNQSDAKSAFFILSKDFEPYLKKISQGALKLYLLYGFKSRNETGESWYSIQSISEILGVSTRSIENWNKELEDQGLIVRFNHVGRQKTTYLLPLSTTFNLISDDDQFEIKQKTIEFKTVYGDLTKKFHIFQWRKGNNDQYNEPYNLLVHIFKNSASKYSVFYKEISPDFNPETSSDEFIDDIYIFDSPLSNLVTGIALKSKFNLKKPEYLQDLFNGLAEDDIDLNAYKNIE